MSEIHAEESQSARGESRRQNAIAIIGIGCRFPGAHGPDEFWRLLLEATDAVDDYRDEGLRQLFPSRSGGRDGTRGGFLTRIDDFDAEFFGMSPREARRTDPQTRLLLETTWEAFEDAGMNPDRLGGSRTGVFVGQAASNYWEMIRQDGEPDIHMVVGSEIRATLPGRVSFTFDLRGPSISVDTACSSSLTAVHQACQSIRAGESELAVAAGVNVVLLWEQWAAYEQARLLAPDGRCKFGDANADGFVRSDGVGVVVLKPLATAVADGDQVYAAILGSAVNNDGRCGGTPMTPGLTSQEELLRHAYRAAGVAPSDITYVEAHGTGTPVGDRVELMALGSVLGDGKAPDRPCLVGSVKTNIGHAEAAAGIAGLIKTALCLHHRTIPANLHFREPNPAVPWDSLPLRVPTDRVDLRHDDRPMIAGVSSFGISGANVHIVLAEHARGESTASSRRAAFPDPNILLLSAQSKSALRDQALSYAHFLSTDGSGRELDVRNICHTAALRRKHLDSRLAVTGSTHEEIERRLCDYLTHGTADGLVASDVLSSSPRVAFVFPGQGSQWLGMGRDLLRDSPDFREAMRRCDDAIGTETGVSILRQLGGDGSRLADVDILQPTLWAIEVSLARVWRSLGLEPDLLVGHSMGEVAAAHVAGILDLADAAAVICRRSRLARRLSGQGAMAATGLSGEEAAKSVASWQDTVAVAACNSPSCTVLSGDQDSLGEALADLARRGIFYKLLPVDFASHSPQVDIIADDLRNALRAVRPRPADIPVHSTVTDEVMDGTAFGPEYWVANLRRPVRFTSAVTAIAGAAPTLFLEISPHPILVNAIRDTLSHESIPGAAVESLCRHQPAWSWLLKSLAKVHVLGGHVNWEQLNEAGRLVRLPYYTWQHKRHWMNVAADAPPDNTERRQNAAGRGRVQGSFELRGDIRLLDPANQAVVEMTGARLQFVATDLVAATPSPPDGAVADVPPQAMAPEADRPPQPGGTATPSESDSIVSEAAGVLGLPADEVPMHLSLRDMGLDSLMAEELAVRIRAKLGIRLLPGLLLAGGSLTEIIDEVRCSGA